VARLGRARGAHLDRALAAARARLAHHDVGDAGGPERGDDEQAERSGPADESALARAHAGGGGRGEGDRERVGERRGSEIETFGHAAWLRVMDEDELGERALEAV